MGEKIFALKTSFPILLGYLAIGMAFGLIMQNASYPWYLTLFMSLIVYAGAGQYALAGLCAAGSGYFEIALAILLINSRHMVYGLPLLEKFKGTMPYTPYMIFGLTDETYGVLTTVKVPQGLDAKKIYFYITLFNHSYWISGGLLGFFIGAAIPFDFAGVDFALTALFVVLLLEQWKYCPRKRPFLIAFVCAIASIVLAGPSRMLVASFVLSIAVLMLLRKGDKTC